MEFTREAWENAPEGSTLERNTLEGWVPVTLIGFSSKGKAVIETQLGNITWDDDSQFRIITPKNKVIVWLWRNEHGEMYATLEKSPFCYDTLLNEHTFEIDGE